MDEIFMKIQDFPNFHLKFPYFYKAPILGFYPVLGGFQMLTWLLIQFSTQFSQWVLIDTFTCENQIENPT